MTDQQPQRQASDELVSTVTKEILFRHPRFDPDRVRAEVTGSYQRLTTDLRIPDHLGVLVQHEATQRLSAAERLARTASESTSD